MSNTSFDLLSLDPDSAKQSLVNFMTGQSILKSYDFTGSVMNELLSLLGTNTYKLMFYMNMINAESWLDSAQLRSSAVSHAKDLNYLPRSSTSSQAIVNLSIPTDGLISVISIPKGTTFSGRAGMISYNFSTNQTVIATSSNLTFQINNLTIYEGIFTSDSYIVDTNLINQRFVLSNLNADISSLTVTVSEDSGASIFEYQFQSSFLGVTPTSLSYFLQCNETENYEVIFGNNLFGREPKNGALITLTYRVASGDIADGVSNFSLNTDVTGGHLSGTVSVSTTSQSSGGSLPEDIESIRFMAPRYYQAQERAVGEDDYETLLKDQFPEIRAVSAIGGENLSPPQYGSVLISVDISNINGLPDSKKNAYLNFLKPRSAAIPIFTIPNIIYYGLNSTVNYDITKTTLLPNDISTIISSSIISYNNTFLDNFKVSFYYSKFTSMIDSSDQSIISNETDVYLYIKSYPQTGISQNLSFNFVVPIYDNYPALASNHPLNEDRAVWSSNFIYNGVSSWIEDDSLGNLRIMQAQGQNAVFVTTIGTVDYLTSQITLTNIKFDSYIGSFKLYIKPATKDISITGNNILTTELDEIHLSVSPQN